MRPALRWLRKCWPDQVETQKAIVKAYRKRFTDFEALDLEDLRTFCNIYDTTERDTPHASAHAEGRRQVYLHISNMLNVNPDELSEQRKAQTDDRDSIRPDDDADGNAR